MMESHFSKFILKEDAIGNEANEDTDILKPGEPKPLSSIAGHSMGFTSSMESSSEMAEQLQDPDMSLTMENCTGTQNESGWNSLPVPSATSAPSPTNEINLRFNNNIGIIVVNIDTKRTFSLVDNDEEKTPITADFYTTPNESKIGNGKPSRTRTITATSRSLHFADSCAKNSIDIGKVTNKRSIQRQIDFPSRKKKRDDINNKIINVNIKDNSGTVAILNSPPAGYLQEEIFREHGEEECHPDSSDGHASFQPETPGKSVQMIADDFFKERLDEVYQLINRLHPLRDNGRWDQFHELVEEEVNVARDANMPHIEVLLTIEMSITFSYQKDFEGSKRKAEEALNQLDSWNDFPIRMFLQAYLYCHWTALNRRNNRSSDAQHCTVIAQQNAEMVPFCGIIKAFAMYEKASNLTKSLSLIDVDEPERYDMYEEGKNALRECIAISERVLQEDRSLYLVRHQFALVKLALMNLNCRTKVSRRKQVAPSCIQEAENCINRIEDRYEDQMNHSIRIQLNNAKSDLCFRTGKLEEAKFHAQEALETAETAGFQLEIKYINERLEDIHAYNDKKWAFDRSYVPHSGKFDAE